jgi:CelD/BcsL family acetyltransferase involved in cellulose biosynthesis
MTTLVRSYFRMRADELSEADWSLWLEIQRQSPVYASPYFRPEFTQTAAAVRDDVEVAVLVENGEPAGFWPFQRGALNLGKPIGGKLSDYHGPIIRKGTSLDASGFLEAMNLASWDFDHLVTAGNGLDTCVTLREKSPQMDLSHGFSDYLRRRREAGSDAVHRQGQKTRKLAREVGPLKFRFDGDDPEAYDLLRQWKSDQLVRTGLTDVFTFPWTKNLLDKLRQHKSTEFSAPLSVLRAGDKVAAVCLSLRSNGVLHSWFTAYNPELASYSPGMTLFVRLAEEAEAQGLHTIDLGRGPERYKWSLASGSAEVCEGSLTRRTLGTLLRASWRRTRDWINGSPLAPATKLLRPMREWMAYQ